MLFTQSVGSFSRPVSLIFRASAGAALLLLAAPALSQTAPDLGTTSPFAIVSSTWSEGTGGTVITGNVCYTTPPAALASITIDGDTETPCEADKGTDQENALADLNAQPCTSLGAAVALNAISIDDGPPGVFPPGCYSSTGAMSITTGTTVTLSGDGVYIFRPDGALDPAANSSVVMADGACSDNVFWTPTGGTTIGANAIFVGTVFRGTADGLSITLGDSASLEGRALAFGSTVTTANNTIFVPDQCPGTIIVEKRTNPTGSPQSFTFTGDAAGSLTDGEQIVVDNLAPGKYSATESVPAGWELTSITCNDADSTGNLPTATANFVLDAGETVTCVFINTEDDVEDGTITILKQASPSDTGQSFNFTGDLGNFSLMHGEFKVETLAPDTYAVAETEPAGWQLDSATCDDGSPINAIVLEAGETVTCVFINVEEDVEDGTIEVTKSGPDTAKLGDEFYYEISFANTGDVDLENCTGDDPLLGGALGGFEPDVVRTFPYTSTDGDPNPLDNTVTITCDVVGGDGSTVSNFDSHLVDLLDPAFELSKVCQPDPVMAGDEIEWIITATNTGNADLECSLDDVEAGISNARFTLKEGESETLNASRLVTADDHPVISNRANASCRVFGFQNIIHDFADAECEVQIPGEDATIEVTKSGPDTAKLGDEFHYEISFSNTGDVDLENCTGDDPLLGGALGSFEPDVVRTFPYTSTDGDPNPLDNTVTITCDVVGGDGSTVSNSDSHSVDLLDPAFELSKVCQPDPVMAGDEIEWIITATNTGNADLECSLDDVEAGINNARFTLKEGESETLNASRLVTADDHPVISNRANASCRVFGFQNIIHDFADADCEVQNPSEEICRTPGFWGTHAGTEHRRSTNLTQMVIDAGGPLSVCGQTIDNTGVGNVHSAVEAMCVRIEGELQRQLARQLTAMALNCIVSGGGADCSGTGVESLFADANAACIAGGGGPELGSWIDQVDDFNNGVDSDCNERELDEFTDIFDGVSPFPGPAGSPRACRDANGNGIKVVPAF